MMGLDMYVTANKFISGYEHSTPDALEEFRSVALAVGLEAIVDADAPSITVEVNIGYWRKFNALHAWVVKTLAEGVDECQEIFISEEDLNRIESVVDQILSDRSKAPLLMPVSPGFFFGSQEYDDWYFEKLAHTKTVISRAKEAMKRGFHINYQASW